MTFAHTCARSASYFWLALCVCFVAITIASPAQAVLESVGFSFLLCEKEMVLEHPDDKQFSMYAMWDTPYQRIRNRSMPWVEVQNLADSDGNLTEFSMTIGDTDYNFTDASFGSYAILSDSTPDVLLQSIVSTGDLLTITFGNGGLAPGEVVRFGIDLAPDPGVDGLFPHPDFRLVLFDMNDLDDNGTNDNSVVTGKFVDPGNSSITETAQTQIADYEVTGNQANYFNQFVRPYGVMEGIDIFGTDVTTTNMIPEPATGVVAVMALGLAVGVWRRRRF